jgi:hypothetical protein
MISSRRLVRLVSLVLSLLLACSSGMTRPEELRAAELELTLQTRDAATGAIQKTAVHVDPHRVGVISQARLHAVRQPDRSR